MGYGRILVVRPFVVPAVRITVYAKHVQMGSSVSVIRVGDDRYADVARFPRQRKQLIPIPRQSSPMSTTLWKRLTGQSRSTPFYGYMCVYYWLHGGTLTSWAPDDTADGSMGVPVSDRNGAWTEQVSLAARCSEVAH